MLSKSTTIEISTRSIIITLLLLVAFYLIFQLISIISLVFVSLIFASALHPLVSFFRAHGLSKTTAILIIYADIFLILTLVISLIVPPLVSQTDLLSNLLDTHLPQVVSQLDSLSIDIGFLAQQFIGVPEDIISFTLSLFSNLIGVITLVIMTFFMLLEFKNLEITLREGLRLLGQKNSTRFMSRLERQLGGWVRGELLLMFIVGVLTYLGLIILGIPYALPLGILAGLLELIPNLGPIISAIPAILVALLISPLHALLTIVLFVLIQQFENNIIVPKVMEKAVGINPLVSLITLMVGFKLGGIPGTMLSIPTLVTAQILFTEFVTPTLKKPKL